MELQHAMYVCTLFVAFTAIFIPDAKSTMTCVCNKDDSENVPVLDSNDMLLGYLNAHQCKSLVTSTSNDTWLTINFNGKMGHLQQDSDFIFVAECPGSEVVATATPASTNKCSPPPIADDLKGNVSRCPKYVVHAAEDYCLTLTQHKRSCYEITDTRVSWVHAQKICLDRGGNLVTIHNLAENDYVHNVIIALNITNPVWLGLHDRAKEGNWQWVNGDNVNFTKWTSHSIHEGLGPSNTQDCAVMKPSGSWEDIHCGANVPSSEIGNTTHSYICEYRIHFFGATLVG